MNNEEKDYFEVTRMLWIVFIVVPVVIQLLYWAWEAINV
jgi:hypothetical protein